MHPPGQRARLNSMLGPLELDGSSHQGPTRFSATKMSMPESEDTNCCPQVQCPQFNEVDHFSIQAVLFPP
eukprot:2555287-Pyramimonas_sp.AAC.1